jgi:glycosyltransferase involved in cell wall biosynthesis
VSISNPALLPGLSIVLPCLNEAENLRDVVRYSTAAAERCAFRHEIVIVDDGSTDDTIAVAGELAAHDSRGAARRARLQPRLRRSAALGDRRGAAAVGADDRCRPAGAVWRRVVQSALELPFRDVDCAYRLARLELLRRLDLHADGALAGAELLVKSRAAGARIVEVEVCHRARVAGRHSGVGTRLTSGTLLRSTPLTRPYVASSSSVRPDPQPASRSRGSGARGSRSSSARMTRRRPRYHQCSSSLASMACISFCVMPGWSGCDD